MPLISVIVPVFNAASTVIETIASVLQQTFADFELIVIDDGSTDGTVAQLRTIRDSRLKIFSYENRGLGAARNRGIRHAQGSFLSFIDADDLWTPKKLELQLKRLFEKPRAGIAYSWTAFIDQGGRFLFAKEPLHFEGDVYSDLLLGCFIASGSNVLIRKTCIESVGLFNEGLRSGEDWDYWLRAARRWSFVVVPQYQIFYRISSSSMSSHVDTIEQESLIILETALRSAPLEYRPLRNQCLANVKQYVAFLYLLHTPAPNHMERAGQRLTHSIFLHLGSLLKTKTYTLLLAWLMLLFVPNKLSRLVFRSILRLHGRLMLVIRPELRTALRQRSDTVVRRLLC